MLEHFPYYCEPSNGGYVGLFLRERPAERVSLIGIYTGNALRRLSRLRTMPHTSLFRVAEACGCGLLSLAILGCGQTGAPAAPSLQLPTPIADLSANRIANHVHLQWTMPRRTTDKLALKGPQAVHICRRVDDGPCATVADVSFPPDKPASYDDPLPADLGEGSIRQLIYSIEVRNRHGRSAGGSNLAYTAAGAAPPAFTGTSATVATDGVLLRWQPASLTGDEHKVSIHRTLLSPPKPVKSENNAKSPFGSATPPLVQDQDLIVRLPGATDTGQALDPDASFDVRYSYRISRINTVVLAGKSIDMEGPISPELVVETKDVFPPRVPSGLAAVSAPEEGAIDLSWSPNTEPDLAGYAVYRSDGGGTAQRISGTAPLDTPNFRDRTAVPGRIYAYSVAAIDRDGNESARSAEATESLPPRP